ncbi:MAG: transposase [Methylacidiphilales bacterium]|nr:transposase [Candidatus Methylacidiphilales bacterium]
MSQMTVLTGPERRRRWSGEERRKIVAAAFAPEAIVADVARRYGVSTSLIYSLIYRWWHEVGDGTSGVGFARAIVVEAGETAAATRDDSAAIVVELAGGVRVEIDACAPAALVMATLKALR